MRSTHLLVEIHNTTAKRDVMSISDLFLAICAAVLSHCFCISIPFSLLTRRKLSFLSPRDNWNLLLLSFYVFLLALLVEYIFLEGLWPIFQSSIHITLYNFFQILTCSWWPSVGSFHVLHLHLSFWLMGTTNQDMARFEPGTTMVNQSPSRGATNWVIQAWIFFLFFVWHKNILVKNCS